jgi:hypothetical protein
MFESVLTHVLGPVIGIIESSLAVVLGVPSVFKIRRGPASNVLIMTEEESAAIRATAMVKLEEAVDHMVDEVVGATEEQEQGISFKEGRGRANTSDDDIIVDSRQIFDDQDGKREESSDGGDNEESGLIRPEHLDKHKEHRVSLLVHEDDEEEGDLLEEAHENRPRRSNTIEM